MQSISMFLRGSEYAQLTTLCMRLRFHNRSAFDLCGIDVFFARRQVNIPGEDEQ